MYPDWPDSAADLVPLPRCNGPKIKPFDFQGPQKIEFLEHIGEGVHAHVFKVKIKGQVYALKLFRFVNDDEWYGAGEEVDWTDREAMTAFYNYSEPFSCECRAFGRLQEAGHEELATKCYGYLFLDEGHERTVMEQFKDLDLSFNGSIYQPGDDELRARFLGKDGRLPPIRGIVKEFGPIADTLRAKDMRKLLRDVVKLQQLGIINLDVSDRQIIGGKFCDFSVALTTPHFITTPELNPHLTPEWISAMEYETFKFSINDYWDFDEMVKLWNREREDQRDISVYAFPDGHGCHVKYNLRSTPARERVYSLVDPRRYDWKAGALERRTSGRRTRGGSRGKSGRAISKNRRTLDAKPPRWYYHCSSKRAAMLRDNNHGCWSTSLQWNIKDGFIFPTYIT